jgi:ABC-2 type transport system permease protein
VYYVVTGSLPGLHAERWYFLLQRLNPLEAFRVLSGAALDEEVSAVPELPVENLPADVSPEQLELANRLLGGEVPFYLTEWFSVVVLVVWGAIPVVLGYWWFERTDLG